MELSFVHEPENTIPVAGDAVKAGGHILIFKAEVGLHNATVGELPQLTRQIFTIF